MHSYLVKWKSRPILKTKLNISKTKPQSYQITEENINVVYKPKLSNVLYNFKIFHENLKPNFVLLDLDNVSTLESNRVPKLDIETQQGLDMKIFEQVEKVNMMIDNYKYVEDCIYELNNILVSNYFEITNNNLIQNKIKKNIESFRIKLDLIKNSYIEKSDEYQNIYSNTKQMFSYRSLIEMLGDQIMRIYQDDCFSIDKIDNLLNFEISMNNFTFKNSSGLEIKLMLELSFNLITTPPVISLKSNKILKDNILQVIEKLKPFSEVKSWSVKYSIYDTIKNIYNMINSFGEVQLENPNVTELMINDLEYLFSIKDHNISSTKLLELFDKDLVSTNQPQQTQSYTNTYGKNNQGQNKFSNEQSDYWKKGTGYGHGNSVSNKWDIDEYITNIKNKKKSIGIKMVEFVKLIDKEIFTNYSKQIINLFTSYLNEDEINTETINKIGSIIKTNINQIDKTDTKSVKLIGALKEYFVENNIQHELLIENQVEKITSVITESLDEFQKTFVPHKFKFVDQHYSNFYYDSNAHKNLNSLNITSEQVTRLQKEFIVIKKSITIDKDASIFFTISKSQINKMRYIITGPIGTPYSYGLYIFDMTIPNEFPNKPPLVHFSNHGGKRFNPNLYDCGKVCLSLLGTWNTPNKSETWSVNSTFNQVLISIQSLILIDEPYFNEPGHEKSIGKPNGIENSLKYNYSIKKYNFDHAINDLMEGIINGNSIYKEFDSVIRNYFKYHKNNIIEMGKKWLEDMPADRKLGFEASIAKFHNLVNKL